MGIFGESIDASSPKLARLTGDDAIMAQAVECLLQTARGTYWDAPEYGYDLAALVASGITADRLATIGPEIEASLLFDVRVASATVTVIPAALGIDSASLTLAIEVTPKGANAAPIQLVATASADLVSVTTRGL